MDWDVPCDQSTCQSIRAAGNVPSPDLLSSVEARANLASNSRRDDREYGNRFVSSTFIVEAEIVAIANEPITEVGGHRK